MYIFRLHYALTLIMILSIGCLSTTTMATDLRVGDLAPQFNMQGTDGKSYQLSDYQGKQAIVLAWYPKAATSGCTIECQSLTKNSDKINAFDVSYFMASVDKLAENQAFATEQQANFPILSDPKKVAAKAYDVLNLFGFANRVTFYIGKNGKILHIDKNVTPKTAAEDMLANLARLGIAKSQ